MCIKLWSHFKVHVLLPWLAHKWVNLWACEVKLWQSHMKVGYRWLHWPSELLNTQNTIQWRYPVVSPNSFLGIIGQNLSVFKSNWLHFMIHNRVHNIIHTECGEYSIEYCESHITLLWIWIMLCHLSVFLYSFQISIIGSSKMISSFPEVLNFNYLFLKFAQFIYNNTSYEC